LSKRQNVETLQATLYKLLQLNPAEKIDVKTLKQTLADSLADAEPLAVTRTSPKKPKAGTKGRKPSPPAERPPLWYTKLKQTSQ
jgi:hypothetical protein